MTERAKLVNKAMDEAVPQKYPDTLYESMRYVPPAGCTMNCQWGPRRQRKILVAAQPLSPLLGWI